MSNLSVLEREGVLVVDSRLVAEQLGIEHKNFLETINKYLTEIESAFERVAFETEPFQTAGGQQLVKVAYLTEDQSTFLVTLSRNTPKVVQFKLALVKAFSEAKRKLQQQDAPQLEPELSTPLPPDAEALPTDQAILRLLHTIKPHAFIRWRGTLICSTQQVADWLGVTPRKIQSYHQRRREEFAEYGVTTRKPASAMRPKMGLHSTANVVTTWTPRALLQVAALIGSESDTGSKLVAVVSGNQLAPPVEMPPVEPAPSPAIQALPTQVTAEASPTTVAVMPSEVSGANSQIQAPDPKLRALTVIQQATRTATEIEALPDGSTLKTILTGQLSRAVQLLNFADFTEAVEQSKPIVEPDPITVADYAKLHGKHLSPFQIQQAGIQAARMFRNRHGANPPKRSVMINGTIAQVNLYPPADLDLVDHAIALAVEA